MTTPTTTHDTRDYHPWRDDPDVGYCGDCHRVTVMPIHVCPKAGGN